MTVKKRAVTGLDPFIFFLIGAVATASLLPAQGVWARAFDVATDIAITLLFFLHGAKLSRAAIMGGVAKWRLHLLVLISSFVLFPILGKLMSLGLASAANPMVLLGLLYLSLLPSTVQSSIAFTAIAGGDVPAAVCSASLSNLTGIVLTPLLVGLLMHVQGAGAGISADAVGSIASKLLLPFVAGHLMRPLIGGFVERNKKILTPVDRGSILLVVYTAFSAAVLEGVWRKTGVTDLAAIVALSAALLGMVMAANLFIARRLGLPREDEIVLLFCGSKKSLVSGVPMAAALFPAAQMGTMILPLMIFHQLQLFVCTVLAMRYRARLPQEAA